MRIIHDVEAPMSASGGGHAYSAKLGMQGYNGMRVELLGCTDCDENHKDMPAGMFGDDEVIHIEGNVKYVKELLLRWIGVIETLEDSYLKQYGELRPANCPNCQPDDIQPNVRHDINCPQHTNYALWQPGGKYYKEPTE